MDEAAVESGEVPHLYDYLLRRIKPGVKIAIPSFDRPTKLCESTLPMLRRHGVDMATVHVFLAPTPAPGTTSPEWHRYWRALREHNFMDVHLEPGGDGLWAQMRAIFRWAGHGTYLLVMTDDVDDIVEKKTRADGSVYSRPLAHGALAALFGHAFDLMRAGNFVAWSLSASHNPAHMSADTISRKLGLLDGNFTGMIVNATFADMVKEEKYGIIYDVAFSTEMWAAGHRFFRYRGLCVSTVYRVPGGIQSTMCVRERRGREDSLIRTLSTKHPTPVQFQEKPAASVRTMQYSFFALGPPPVHMTRPAPQTGGRWYEGLATRAMTDAER